jgi:flagellar hook-associated protein 2
MSMTLSGVATGMDTEGLIDQLLEVDRLPAYRLDNKNYELENKLKAWGTVDTKLSELQSATEELSKYSVWSQKKGGSSDEDVATVTAETGAVEGSYDINVTQLATSHMVASDAQADTTSALSMAGSFTIGGETVTVEATDSLKDIRDAINNAALSMAESDKVRATIVDTTLVLERDETGATDINITDDSDEVLTNLGILVDNADPATPGSFKNELRTAQNMTATVNQISVTRSQNTGLDDIVDGVSFNFHDAGSAVVDIDRDTDSIRSLIDDFIAKYNAAMSTIEQKSKVEVGKEGDVEDVGLLQGESLLNSIVNKARSFITASDSDLPEEFDRLSDVGIGTQSEDNRIAVVDSEKFTDALTNNFDEIEDIFNDFENGIVRKFNDYLYDSLVDPISGSVNSRQENIQKQINRNQDEIDRIFEQVEDRRKMLKEKFAFMESSIGQLNSQVGFLSSSLGINMKGVSLGGASA